MLERSHGLLIVKMSDKLSPKRFDSRWLYARCMPATLLRLSQKSILERTPLLKEVYQKISSDKR